MARRSALAAFHDLSPPVQDSLGDAVLAGLTRQQKAIPCRFLYDERGSALFEAICELPEYYPTRTEIAILEERAPEIAALAGPHARLIEFGSGSSRKVRILLAALDRPSAYTPIDISREHLRRAAEDLAAEFPDLAVIAVCADYTRSPQLPPLLGDGERLGFFPGSTIGNFTSEEAVEFLRGCRDLLGTGGELIVGVDLKKDPVRLHAAYNDAAGVTAEFNLNLLARINRELGADFALDRFAHEARYNPRAGRIEIYIRSLADQVVTVLGRRIRFAAGERIHTEYSYKYAIDEFQALAGGAGFRPVAAWTDREALFSVHYLRAA